LRLNPKPGLVFAWRTEEIVAVTGSEQQCVEGRENLQAKTLT
jgi:hypothetical protein